jgi:hypothetical protein
MAREPGSQAEGPCEQVPAQSVLQPGPRCEQVPVGRGLGLGMHTGLAALETERVGDRA